MKQKIDVTQIIEAYQRGVKNAPKGSNPETSGLLAAVVTTSKAVLSQVGNEVGELLDQIEYLQDHVQQIEQRLHALECDL